MVLKNDTTYDKHVEEVYSTLCYDTLGFRKDESTFE